MREFYCCVSESDPERGIIADKLEEICHHLGGNVRLIDETLLRLRRRSQKLQLQAVVKLRRELRVLVDMMQTINRTIQRMNMFIPNLE